MLGDREHLLRRLGETLYQPNDTAARFQRSVCPFQSLPIASASNDLRRCLAIMRPLQNSEYFSDLTGANHLPGIRESHAVSSAIRHDDSTRGFVRFMARPVALELQKHLYPAGELSAGLL